MPIKKKIQINAIPPPTNKRKKKALPIDQSIFALTNH